MIRTAVKILLGFSWLALSSCAVFQSSYSAQPEAMNAIASAQETDYGWQFEPKNNETTSAQLIFYPGGKVEPQAYALLLQDLANTGMTVSLVKFPLDLAVFNSKIAQDIINPSMPTVIAGHSLGGAMAANFSKDNLQSIDGLILLAAYSLESYGLENSTLPVLSIFASNDAIATEDDINSRRQWLPETTEYVRIEGGNHAQFGSYGDQHDDGTATISASEQRRLTVEAVAQFIDGLL